MGLLKIHNIVFIFLTVMNNMFLKLLEKYGAPVTNIISSRLDTNRREIEIIYSRKIRNLATVLSIGIFSLTFFTVLIFCVLINYLPQ